MKNKKEILLEVFENITPVFEKKGFVLNKTNNSYIRKENQVHQIVDFICYSKRDYIAIEPRIRIKIKEIEKIYKSISKIKERPYCSLGNHLFMILKYIDEGIEIESGSAGDWLVKDASSIQKLIKIIPEYLIETIIPYFNENSSIDKVDYLLNKYPRELSIHNPLYPLRVNITIIAAKLNKNSNYPNLVNIYKEEMQNAEQNYKQEFLKLLEI